MPLGSESFNSPIWNWILPFLTSFLFLFLILPVTSCLIHFLSKYLQQQLQPGLQDYCSLDTELEACTSQLYPDGEGQVLPKDVNAPSQQEVV